mgnify:FL=1
MLICNGFVIRHIPAGLKVSLSSSNSHRIHMKKTLILLSSLLAFSCMTAQAAIYTWTPIDGSTDWSQASNWQTETGASADVPLVNPNWGTVNVSGNHTVVCGPGTTVEGWTSTINVSNGANVSLQNFTKFQRTTVSVGEGSTLTVGKTSGSIVANCDQNMNWTVYGTLNLPAALTWNANSNNLFVDLGTTGILNLTNQTDLGRFAFSASLGDLITEGTTFELVTRELVNGVGSAATSNTTITGGTQSDDIAAEALTAENVGKYQVFTKDGKIYVSYINGVPEPATVSLSLLMLRRRR